MVRPPLIKQFYDNPCDFWCGAVKKRMPQCPICQKPTVVEFKPFCNKRCQQVDAYRWFSGAYAAPAVEQDETDEAAMEVLLARADRDGNPAE